MALSILMLFIGTLSVKWIVRLELHVIDRLKHCGLSSVRELLEPLLFFYSSLVDDVLDSARCT